MSKEIILLKENAIASIIKDIFTFGCLFLFYYLNFNYLGNSTIVSLTISICFFLSIAVKAHTKPLTIEEAKKKLEELAKG